jgi:hypothetical protein
VEEFRTIEIDFEVHKRIEAARASFSDSPNDVLRKLLQIEREDQPVPAPAQSGRPWSGKGVVLPHGTKLKMDYNGVTHSGEIIEGAWVVEGRTFKSPSAAAGGVALTRKGTHTSLDGWEYWHVKRPGDARWILSGDLRQK